MKFKILKRSKKSKARIGLIKINDKVLHTPAFLPVASLATVRTLTSEEIQEIGYEAVLCNTYHLHLRPGEKLIKKFGGLHKFMNFKGIIFTDSGGFQVFSLGKGLEDGVGKLIKTFPEAQVPKLKKKSLVKITERGVYFKSHIDGKQYFLSPEKSIQIQEDLGADIIFAFDECTSPVDSYSYVEEAMNRTHRWAKRCLNKVSRSALFGIVQGGEFKDLRIKSAKFINSLDFDGFGIGGSLGKTKKRMFEILNWAIPYLDEGKPRHLLGIGYLEDMIEAVKRGVDLFDCVYPARYARHGVAITSKGEINLTKSKFLKDKNPLDKNCKCFVCKNYFRGYISHLIRAKELTGLKLLTYHNLYFVFQFMKKLREDIYLDRI